MVAAEGEDALFLLEKSVARETSHCKPVVRVDAERRCLLTKILSYIGRIVDVNLAADCSSVPAVECSKC